MDVLAAQAPSSPSLLNAAAAAFVAATSLGRSPKAQTRLVAVRPGKFASSQSLMCTVKTAPSPVQARGFSEQRTMGMCDAFGTRSATGCAEGGSEGNRLQKQGNVCVTVCVCVHPDSKLRVLARHFVQSLKQQQGDAGEFCSRHPTKTLQFSCDMESGRGFHVPAFH